MNKLVRQARIALVGFAAFALCTTALAVIGVDVKNVNVDDVQTATITIPGRSPQKLVTQSECQNQADEKDCKKKKILYLVTGESFTPGTEATVNVTMIDGTTRTLTGTFGKGGNLTAKPTKPAKPAKTAKTAKPKKPKQPRTARTSTGGRQNGDPFGPHFTFGARATTSNGLDENHAMGSKVTFNNGEFAIAYAPEKPEGTSFVAEWEPKATFNWFDTDFRLRYALEYDDLDDDVQGQSLNADPQVNFNGFTYPFQLEMAPFSTGFSGNFDVDVRQNLETSRVIARVTAVRTKTSKGNFRPTYGLEYGMTETEITGWWQSPQFTTQQLSAQSHVEQEYQWIIAPIGAEKVWGGNVALQIHGDVAPGIYRAELWGRTWSGGNLLAPPQDDLTFEIDDDDMGLLIGVDLGAALVFGARRGPSLALTLDYRWLSQVGFANYPESPADNFAQQDTAAESQWHYGVNFSYQF